MATKRTNAYVDRNIAWLAPLIGAIVFALAKPIFEALVGPGALPTWFPGAALAAALLCMLAAGFGLTRVDTASSSVSLRVVKYALVAVAIVLVAKAILS